MEYRYIYFNFFWELSGPALVVLLNTIHSGVQQFIFDLSIRDQTTQFLILQQTRNQSTRGRRRFWSILHGPSAECTLISSSRMMSSVIVPSFEGYPLCYSCYCESWSNKCVLLRHFLVHQIRTPTRVLMVSFNIHRFNLVTGQEGNKGAEGTIFLFASLFRRNQFSVIIKECKKCFSCQFRFDFLMN